MARTAAARFACAVPHTAVVIGGGVIGLELGSVWSRLGSKVRSAIGRQACVMSRPILLHKPALPLALDRAFRLPLALDRAFRAQ
jgi:hypothetical protein